MLCLEGTEGDSNLHEGLIIYQAVCIFGSKQFCFHIILSSILGHIVFAKRSVTSQNYRSEYIKDLDRIF